jgi:hypothetical protein
MNDISAQLMLLEHEFSNSGKFRPEVKDDGREKNFSCWIIIFQQDKKNVFLHQF